MINIMKKINFLVSDEIQISQIQEILKPKGKLNFSQVIGFCLAEQEPSSQKSKKT